VEIQTELYLQYNAQINIRTPKTTLNTANMSNEIILYYATCKINTAILTGTGNNNTNVWIQAKITKLLHMHLNCTVNLSSRFKMWGRATLVCMKSQH